MVGIGTVLKDDPQLTVRLVPGASPLRVVVDSTLSIPLSSLVLNEEAATLVLTTKRADPVKRRALQERNVGIREIREGSGGVDLPSALKALRDMGVESLLVEGGASLITSLLGASLVDRIIVAIAPVVIGSGTEGVGDLGVARISEGLALSNRSMYAVEDDVVMAWDIERTGA
jgi:riboflavin-specific deaminase-like protein